MIRTQEQRLPGGLQRMDEQEIVFRRGTAGRALCGITSLLCAAAGFFLLWMMFAHHGYFTGAWSYSAPAAYGAMALGAWYLAGPRETTFDIRRGTYRFTTGFPLAPRVQHGSCSELAGLFLKSIRTSSNRPPYYSVCLAWSQLHRKDIVLLSVADPDVAARVMRRTADALGLPAGEAVLERLWFRNPRLRRCDGQSLVFHKPPAVRLAWGIFGKMIAVASLVLSGSLVVKSGGLHLHPGTTNMGIILMDVLALLCLRAAGPEDLVVDLENRTYRCRRGFPCVSVERKGPLDDIIALKTDGQSPSPRRVRLVWKQPSRGDMTLAEFASPEEADAHRRMVAVRLGLRLN